MNAIRTIGSIMFATPIGWALIVAAAVAVYALQH